MLHFQNNNIPGELWLRDLKGNKESATTLLSAVYEKYHSLNPILSSRNASLVYARTSTIYDTFYGELTSNQITRFDVFYDSVFIETKSGCIFEKIYLDKDQIKPFTIADCFTPKHDAKPKFLNFDTYVDYWFDDSNNKVYFTYIACLEENKDFPNRIAFVILVNEFDCETGLITTILFWKVILSFKNSSNWDIRNCVIENPKITFNSTTRTFNVSFLLKNSIKQFGLVSINFKKIDNPFKGDYAITEVNAYLPYFEMDGNACEAYPYDPNAKPPYYVVTAAKKPSEDLRFILMTNSSQDIFFHPLENYMILE